MISCTCSVTLTGVPCSVTGVPCSVTGVPCSVTGDAVLSFSLPSVSAAVLSETHTVRQFSRLRMAGEMLYGRLKNVLKTDLFETYYC